MYSREICERSARSRFEANLFGSGQDAALIKVTEMTKMMFDSQDTRQVLTNAPAFEPLDKRRIARSTAFTTGAKVLDHSGDS